MIDIFTSHGFEIDIQEQDLFQRFLQLFINYNSHTNLSAIRQESDIIEKHFLDSLYGSIAILPDMGTSKKMIDIGSGGWFPWIPLKIVLPQLQVTLLDSVWKKVKAMNHFIAELWLQDISAIQERAEILWKQSEHKAWYDFVVSRATAYITDILKWSELFLNDTGKIILYKMPWDQEKQDMHKVIKKLWLSLESEHTYTIQGKQRVLYVFSRF